MTATLGGPSSEVDGGYRAHLDGVRCVAVYLVVAFHAGVLRASGGFIGVDVFFVLSGYLVTRLLCRDLDGPGRRIGWGRFYSRRVRRLLPAAAVNLVVTAVVFAAIAAPVELAQAEVSIRAAALYVANWSFIHQSATYFATDVDASPVLQYWSLSVEEQFYLLWPPLLAGLYAVTRRMRTHRVDTIRAVVGVGMVASAGAALLLAASDLDRAYYGTDTRAYQLLAGALLALSPGVAVAVRRSRAARVLPAASMALLGVVALSASSLLTINPIQRGVLITAVTCGLLVSLEASSGGVARTVLSWSPIAYLGRISYGTYLWHWLVVIVLAREADLAPLATLAVTVAVATGLASLSYQVLENPIRIAALLDRWRRPVIGAGLAVSVLVGLVVAPNVLSRASGDTTLLAAAAPPTGVGAVPSEAEIRAALLANYDYGSCEVSGPVACPLVEGSGATALVVGESHAGMVTPMLVELAKRHDMSLHAGYLSYCPWTRGVQYVGVNKDCLAEQDDMFDRILPELDPDIVFLAHRPVDDLNDPLDVRDADEGHLTGDARLPALRRRITDVVTGLRADGRTVVMFEPVPAAASDEDPLTCLSEAESVEECRFVTSSRLGGEEAIMRELAEADQEVVSVDLDLLSCPYSPICDPVVDGQIVRSDTNHLTTTFATSLLDPVDSYLIDQGVLSPP